MAGALGMESSGVQLQGAELKGLCKQRSIMKEETNYKQKNKRNAVKSTFLSLKIMPQTGIEPVRVSLPTGF